MLVLQVLKSILVALDKDGPMTKLQVYKTFTPLGVIRPETFGRLFRCLLDDRLVTTDDRHGINAEYFCTPAGEERARAEY